MNMLKHLYCVYINTIYDVQCLLRNCIKIVSVKIISFNVAYIIYIHVGQNVQPFTGNGDVSIFREKFSSGTKTPNKQKKHMSDSYMYIH